VEDQNNCRNYHRSDSHKTINPQDDSQEEVRDSPDEDLPEEEEDSPEEVEDSLEEEDIQEEVAYHLGDHQEVLGGHPHFRCHKHKPENW